MLDNLQGSRTSRAQRGGGGGENTQGLPLSVVGSPFLSPSVPMSRNSCKRCRQYILSRVMKDRCGRGAPSPGQSKHCEQFPSLSRLPRSHPVDSYSRERCLLLVSTLATSLQCWRRPRGAASTLCSMKTHSD